MTDVDGEFSIEEYPRLINIYKELSNYVCVEASKDNYTKNLDYLGLSLYKNLYSLTLGVMYHSLIQGFFLEKSF